MRNMPNWIYWFISFGILAAVYAIAEAGDPYAKAAIPMLPILRGLGLCAIVLVMTSAWYEPRGIVVNVLHFGTEAIIVLALIAGGHYLVAALTILTLALYEFARERVAVPY